MATAQRSTGDVKDISLAEKGKRKIEWANQQMPVLQLIRKRFIKERIWPHLPGRAILLFFYMYVFRLGFLDGPEGFIFCYMHAIFQQFNIVKLWEMQREEKSEAKYESAASR